MPSAGDPQHSTYVAGTTSLVPLPRILLLVAFIPPVLWCLSLAVALASPSRLGLANDIRWIFPRAPGIDFFCYRTRMPLLHTPALFSAPGFPWFYPAPCIFLYQPFYALAALLRKPLAGTLSFEAVALALALALAWNLRRALCRHGVAPRAALLFVVGSLVASWPLYLVLQRGNIEALTWPLLALAVVAFWSGNGKRAAVLVGACGAFKLYPLLCLGLFLPGRQWKHLGLGLLTAAVITLVALRYMEPDIALAARSVQHSVTHWTQAYALQTLPTGSAYDHSASQLSKFLSQTFHLPYAVLVPATLVTTGVVAATLYRKRLTALPRTNQVLFLVTACVLLPPASFDYTLCNLFVPFALLAVIAVDQSALGGVSRANAAALLLLAVLFAPETFLTVHQQLYAGPFKASLLVSLLLLSATAPLEDPRSTARLSATHKINS